MKHNYNILSFERDDSQEKLLESSIKSTSVQFKFKRVTNWNEYTKELMRESFDCILCDEDTLKDSEKRNIVKYAKEITPFTPFIHLSSLSEEDIDEEIVKKSKLSYYFSKNNLRDVTSKIIESKSDSRQNSIISNYWG